MISGGWSVWWGSWSSNVEVNSVRPIYYLAYHPTDAVLYSDFCRFFRRYLPEASQHLIVAAHPYFECFDCSSLFDLFDQVVNLPGAGYSARLKALLKNVNYKRHVAHLTFLDDAIVMTHALTHTELTINLLLRRIRQTARRARIVTLDVGAFYETMPRPSRTNDWRACAGYALSAALLGAYSIVGQFRARRFVHQVYAHEKQIIDQYVVLSNHFENCPDYVIVKHPVNLAMSSRDMNDGEEKISSQPGYVFFFGNQRLPKSYPEVDQVTLVSLTNAILARLTELYAASGVRLLYKPHPFEMGQPILFNLNGFQLFDKPYPAEMVYNLYGGQIRAVYSVSSMSATTASLYGIHSFVFFEMLPFSSSTRALLRRYLLDAGRVVSVHSLDELKVEEARLRPVFNDHDATHLLEALYGN